MFGVKRNLNLTCICGREILMAYTHKTHAVDNDGNIISSADFDFYIDEVAQLFCTNYGLIFLASYASTCILIVCACTQRLLFNIPINLLGERMVFILHVSEVSSPCLIL